MSALDVVTEHEPREDHHVDMSKLTLTPSATLLTDDEIHENIQITKDLSEGFVIPFVVRGSRK